MSEQVLTQRAINANVYRTYQEDDEYHRQQRVPEVGAKACFRDGREFVFVSTAVDVAVGQVVAKAYSVAAPVSGATASGGKTVVVTLAGATADQYAGGYFKTAAGTVYTIAGNTATDTGTVTLTLDADLCQALTDAEASTISTFRQANVVIGTATNDGIGVAIQPSTAATAGKTQYMWVQTKGRGAAKVTTGSTAVDGAALMQDAAGALVIGTAGQPQVAIAANDVAVGNGAVADVLLDFC